MQIFKFGGASVKNSEGIKNVGEIIQKYRDSKAQIIVVSATGKTTNQLEEVVEKKFSDLPTALLLLQSIREKHEHILEELGIQKDHPVFSDLNSHFVEAEWVIEEERLSPYDFTYDQIVSIGELISSRILTAWLDLIGLNVEWIDARDLILTDDTYREGRIQWKETNKKIQDIIRPSIQAGKIVVTQGFIGSTAENNTTTLGREGSDYTAAILSSALKSDSMTIWKDVPGILTAIQPLQLQSIPLYVKSFISPESAGSLISTDIEIEYPPIVVLEKNQALLHFSSTDLSFIAEHHMARLFNLFEKHRIKVNMMRNTAITFTVCVTNDSRRISNLLTELKAEYVVVIDSELELITVRHYIDSMLTALLENKIVVLEERIKKTLQMVVKDAPCITFKKGNEI